VIGAPPPAGETRVPCRLLAFAVAVELGRFRKARHAGVVRQRLSGDELMAQRYDSRPCLRCSVRAGEEVVRVNQDFWGSGQGGGEPVRVLRVWWRETKSE
jgi:hypothetical protein